MSEQMLIWHCAPTLAGLKAGSLFSCSFQHKEEVLRAVRHLNQKLQSKGLRVLPLRYLQNRALIYVYRPTELAAELSSEDAQQLLAEAGYQTNSAEQSILELIRRIKVQEDFPHEIGLFLSYPPEDVRGFIENSGRACKFVGCWKVYGDAEHAQKTFARYKQCTDSYYSQWEKGISIERLTVAV